MGRTPDGTPPFMGADVLEIVGLLGSAGVDVWVDGGWGIDALLGEQTRPHTDLDLALPTRHWQLAQQALAARSFTLIRDDGPYNVVFMDPPGRLVDLHAFDDTTTVVGDDGIERHGPDGLAYETGGFCGVGIIDGHRVACMSAEFQMRSHTGYEVDEGDWHDVRHLHDRFGLPIPPDYARWSG
jgi:lincosamide nucleotidyltransferase A/C/D/E